MDGNKFIRKIQSGNVKDEEEALKYLYKLKNRVMRDIRHQLRASEFQAFDEDIFNYTLMNVVTRFRVIRWNGGDILSYLRSACINTAIDVSKDGLTVLEREPGIKRKTYNIATEKRPKLIKWMSDEIGFWNMVVLWLYYCGGYSHRKIAEVVPYSNANTSKSVKSKAMIKLRQAVEDNPEFRKFLRELGIDWDVL